MQADGIPVSFFHQQNHKISYMEQTEIWKDIVGYEGLYQVSDQGRVRSIRKMDTDSDCRKVLSAKVLRPAYRRTGHAVVGLRRDGKNKTMTVHRLVATAFIPNPNNYPIINHKDEDPRNNRVDNLEWCTFRYNGNYGTCLKRRSGASAKRVCGGDDVIYVYSLDNELFGRFETIWEAVDALGLSGDKRARVVRQKARECCRGKIKTAFGFIWKYERNVPPSDRVDVKSAFIIRLKDLLRDFDATIEVEGNETVFNVGGNRVFLRNISPTA